MTDAHQRFFGVWSRFYARTPVLARLLRAQQDEALRVLAPAPGERGLDLGCGSGRALGLSPGLTPGLAPQLFGADFSRAMLAGAPRGRVACARASALPFRDATFDALLCTNAFHHCPEPLATLREVRRVLRPSGRAVFVDPNLAHPLSRLSIYGGEALCFGMDVHLHTPAQWVALAREAGFASATVTELPLLLLPAVSLRVLFRA